ncbi:MAG: hypothetical protein EA401_02255 [Planctomycetota bacterium]|nr:MAG: hypothetical protein EA401_02255 [Planctomycetota bacterium]
MNRFIPLFLLAAAVALGACSPRDDHQDSSSALHELHGTQLATLTGDEREMADQQIVALRGAPIPEGWEAQRIWSLGAHHVLVLQGSSDDYGIIAVELLSAGDGKRWQRRLNLNAESRLSNLSLGSHSEVATPVLMVELEGEISPDVSVLYLAIGSRQATLVRATDSQRRIRHRHLSSAHPHLEVDSGDLGSRDSSAQLAALIALAQPGSREARHRSGVRSQLDVLAGSTNLWLAEGAALVLTLP